MQQNSKATFQKIKVIISSLPQIFISITKSLHTFQYLGKKTKNIVLLLENKLVFQEKRLVKYRLLFQRED